MVKQTVGITTKHGQTWMKEERAGERRVWKKQRRKLQRRNDRLAIREGQRF